MSDRNSGFGRRLGRFVGWNLGQQAWFILLSLASTPILYRALGEDAFGLLSLVNVVVAQVAVLEFGFGHATIRWLGRARASEDTRAEVRVVRTSVWVFAATALVGVLAILASRDWLATEWFDIPIDFEETARTTFGIAAGLLVTTLFGNLASSLWQGLQRFDRLNVIVAAGATAQVLGSVALAVAGRPVQDVVLWTTALGVGLLAIHMVLLRKVLAKEALTGPPDPAVFREMAGYGAILMLAGVFSQIHLTTGSLLLGSFVAIGALPWFTIPFSIFQRAYRIAGAISSALFPLVVELHEKQDSAALKRLYLSGTRALILAGTIAGIPALLLTGPFLTVWMGADFAEMGAPVLRRLAAAAVLVLATVPSVELARGRGRPGRVATYVGILALANLVGVALLAPSNGVTGAASAFLIAQAVGSLVLASWVGGADVGRIPTLRIGVFVAVAIALWWGLAPRIEDVEVIRGLLAALVSGAILAGLGAWVLDPEERRVLRRIVGSRE